jgi:hypothetical protein
MIHNNYKISLLYETGQVKVCKVERVASGEKNESVYVGECMCRGKIKSECMCWGKRKRVRVYVLGKEEKSESVCVGERGMWHI